MHLQSKKIALVVVGVVSFVCSRAVFFLINDPGGSNLVVVTGLSAIIYCIFLAVYFYLKKAQL